MRKSKPSNTSISGESFVKQAIYLRSKVMDKVEIIPNDRFEKPCLIWGGGETKVIRIANSHIPVVTIMYCSEYKIPWVPNTQVRYKCENGIYGCIEPSHLEFDICSQKPVHNCDSIPNAVREALNDPRNFRYKNNLTRTPCKIWQGRHDGLKIPYIEVNRKHVNLVYLVYAFANNMSIEELHKYIVRRTCGSKLCLEPDHIKIIGSKHPIVKVDKEGVDYKAKALYIDFIRRHQDYHNENCGSKSMEDCFKDELNRKEQILKEFEVYKQNNPEWWQAHLERKKKKEKKKNVTS